MKFPIFILGLVLLSCVENNRTKTFSSSISIPKVEKMAGFSLEMPPDSIPPNSMEGIVNLGGKWVALIPYSIIRKNSAEVEYNHKGMWWGESPAGTTECIRMAKKSGLKTMLKPHVWVIGQGWPGNFDLNSEAEWLAWESSYRKYILEFAKIGEEQKVDLFCIGTEFRIAVVKREQFWRKLIEEVREIYKGEITYASNWDNYHNVKFWDELDYIGTDAYFPHSEDKEPEFKVLLNGWKKEGAKLKAFSEKWKKKVIFTEYGFRSCDYFNSNSSQKKSKNQPNMGNQERAYQAFFQSVWQEDWMLGGFLWKWHFREDIGGENDSDYTPQNKPAALVIQKYYKNAS